MKPDTVVLREVELRLKTPFLSSKGQEHTRRVLVVEARRGSCVGYGEVPVLSGPYYIEETLGTAWHVISEYLLPLFWNASWNTPGELAHVLSPIRRHYMAKAGLEEAVWDLHAQEQGLSLAQVVGGTRAKVAAGISIGMQPTIEALVQTVGVCVAQGYARVKVKIGPGHDIEPLQAIRQTFPHVALMADANSAYTLADVQHLKQLDRLQLMMIEQPLGADDIIDHAQLQSQIATPICLDESIYNAHQAHQAIELGSCRVVNIKLARVGGWSEALRIHQACTDAGVPVWCGGMLETGIGRAHNLALASLAGFSLPGDISPSARYFDSDIISPEIIMDHEGYITVPNAPGLGVMVNLDRLAACTRRIQVFQAD